MREGILERENRATREYPYIEGARKNLGARVHCHEEIEMICVLSGTVDVTVDGVTEPYRDGDVCIVMPGEAHAYHTREASLTYVMKLYTPSAFCTLRLGERRLAPGNAAYPRFRAALDTIVREDTVRDAGSAYAVAAETNVLLLMILRTLTPVRISEREQKELRANAAFLETFEVFLDAHYAEPLALDTAAAAMHYSRYYFAHRFRAVTGQSFLEYVTEYRLEKARAALLGGKRVVDVAFECGFGSLRSFYRAFRRYYGASPAENARSNTEKT